MLEQTLITGAKENLALLGQSRILQDAYLAGGTGLALQLGHRISVDFGFFTASEFMPRGISAELANMGTFRVEQAGKDTVIGEFRGIKFSLFPYRYPLLYPPITYRSLKIADVRDIAAMKIDAIATRGTKRDFIDLYFICKSNYTLSGLLNFYDKKYGALGPNLIHIQKSLVFFDDAEIEERPRILIDVKWQDVKKYFEHEVKNLFKTQSD